MAPRVRRAIGRLIESNRGSWLLECEGHRYRKRRSVSPTNKTYWRCVDEDECNGTAITLFEIEDTEVVNVTLGKTHTHHPDFAKNIVHSIMTTIKRRARTQPNERPLTIVQETLSQVNDREVLMRLPTFEYFEFRRVFRLLKDNLVVTESYQYQVSRLYVYVKETFVTGVSARGRRQGRAPRYAPEIWNQYEATVNQMSRTNNYVEAWNGKFSKLIGTHHPNIYKFIEFMKKDERDNEIVILQLAGGHINVKHKIPAKYKQNQLHIERIVGNYETYKNNGDFKTYLEAIAFRLKRPNSEEVAGEIMEEDDVV